MIGMKDKAVIHGLASEVAEIAALPIQEEKRRLWRKLNSLRPERPMVMVDNVCWNEFEGTGELALQCEDEECRGYERQLRRTLYQWRHFPVDRVVDPFLRVPKAILDHKPELRAHGRTVSTDGSNSVLGHEFENQFEHDEDLGKIHMPEIEHDWKETERRMAVAHDLFRGTLDVFEDGHDPYFSVWDSLTTLMGGQALLWAMVDRPEFMLALAKRMVEFSMSLFDQLENLGLLCHNQSLIHCTGAFTDELPAPGFDPKKPRTKDIWMFGLAQIFSTVSPAMFEEYEIDVCMPVFERFGLVYYGCCDPLDRKMKQVRRIPNLRKVSMSPWVDEELGASEIRGDYVYSRKPNPALLADLTFDETVIRNHLQTTADLCRKYGCPLELIQKDISTVRYEPQRLFRWAEIAMDVAGG